MSDEILSQILRNQADAAEDRQQQGNMISEIRTVLLGPTGQPDSGVLATVGRLKIRVGRIEKGIIYLAGGGGLGAGVWNFGAIKTAFAGLLS